MSAVVLYVPPPPPPAIEAVIPVGWSCEANGCANPVQADMVWHEERAGSLHLISICGKHLFLLQGRKGALFFPLGTAPPLEYIAAKMQEEMRRREMARRRQAPQWQPTYASGFGTNTGFGGNFFVTGNIHFTNTGTW